MLGEREVDQECLTNRIAEAFELGPDPVESPTLILGTVKDIAG